MIKAHLDGSAGEGVIGLAAFVASENQWARFERDWQALLKQQRMTHVHMKDLYQRQDSFKGKDATQAWNAANAFVQYLAGRHDWAIRRYSCVVRKADYQRALQAIPVTGRLANKPLHAICVDHCTGRIFRPKFREENDPPRNIEVWFDGNEAFYKYIHAVWNVEKDDPTSWASEVVTVAEMYDPEQRILPKQAADVLAWVSRRYRARGDHKDWHDALCGGKRTQTNCHDFFDYDALVRKYSDEA